VPLYLSDMRSKINFYFFIAALTVLDAVLLRSPNLLGKIGLLIYKYHYLRTFPKALLTVLVVVGLIAAIVEIIHFAVRKGVIRRLSGQLLFLSLCLASLALLVKTVMDFSTGMYSHTGLRFRCGAYLMPAILLITVVYAWVTLPKPFIPFPELPSTPETIHPRDKQ
jgi:uncharacterized membrane protein